MYPTTKIATKRQIMVAVHETAVGLHPPGFIDQRKMRKSDAMCLDPIPAYGNEKVRILGDRAIS